MKKILLLLTLTIGLVACQKDDVTTTVQLTGNTPEEFVILDDAYVIEGGASISADFTKIETAENRITKATADLNSVGGLNISDETLANLQLAIENAQDELSAARSVVKDQLQAGIDTNNAILQSNFSIKIGTVYTFISPSLDGYISSFTAERKSGFVKYGFRWSTGSVIITN